MPLDKLRGDARLRGEQVSMLDRNGKLIRLGDRVAVGSGISGVVVFSIDTDEFSSDFPREQWVYLGRGIMIRTERAGLVHVREPAEDIEIVR